MARFTVTLVPVLSDNYSYLLRNAETGSIAIIDPGDAAPLFSNLGGNAVRDLVVLNTHHHGDHTGGNLDLRMRYELTVYGPKEEADRIPGIDHRISDGDILEIGGITITAIHTPGHTLGHLCYYLETDMEKVLFSGDTLFSLGCGRLFEGTPQQMNESLQKLSALPPETRVYCGHEYTEKNGAFALSVEPGNVALRERVRTVTELRKRGEPTIPSSIALELQTNPFLRLHSREIRTSLGLDASADPVTVLGLLRERRNVF